MNEQVIQFGNQKNLIGVLTQPENSNTERPVFIFVNSGLLHRVGPFRIYVSTARALAKDNFTSFRMDLSGKGDSQPKQNSLSLKENTNQDIMEAMDHLQQTIGAKSFVVCGICTGADNAYEIAFNDDRVKAVIPVDGYAYPTTGFHLRKFFSRLTNINSWKNLVRKVGALFSSNNEMGKSELTANYRMVFPEKDHFERNMSRVLDKGVEFLVIFTGGWYMFYNYAQQFADSLTGAFKPKQISVEHNKKTDHTFILQKDKEWLIQTIVDWAKVKF